MDRAAERIASAQKLKAKGPVQPGKAGDMIARVYDLHAARWQQRALRVRVPRAHEYSIACFWDPAHAAQPERRLRAGS